MSWVSAYSTSETGHCSVKLLGKNILMTKQSVSVSKAGVHLNSSLEEFYGRVVLFLQTVAIASRCPSLNKGHIKIVQMDRTDAWKNLTKRVGSF